MVSPKKETKQKLASGFPPAHAAALVGFLLGTSIVLLPTDLDDFAKVETFSRRVFPQLMSLEVLAYTRCAIAAFCWLVTIYMLTCAKDLQIKSKYRPKSKLVNAYFPLTGLYHLCPFTSWSWILLSTSYTLNGYISLVASLGKEKELDPLVLEAAFLMWEVAAPFAILVSTVVRYAIWPPILASKRPHQLSDFLYQMQHNANSVFALFELCHLGGIPVKMSHISIAALVGGIYIIFTWGMCFAYTDVKMGPQYLYWFMDTTLGKETTISLLALLFVLVLAFAVFSCIAAFVEWTGPSLLVHTFCLVLLSSAVIKTS